MASVAVVVPIYREVLLPDEQISLRHLRKHLSGYDWYSIAPPNLKVPDIGAEVKRFSFQSLESYSRVLLGEAFYTAFTDYEFILIYQLDALVFCSRLEFWCNQGFDYIGAPLLKSPQNSIEGFLQAGNGGLSLRRVVSFLRVIGAESSSTPHDWRSLRRALAEMPADIRALPVSQRIIKMFRVCRAIRFGPKQYMSTYTLNEDLFWSFRARLFAPQFRVAPVPIALDFAFDRAPRYCFEQNSHRLPFGCHAWGKWDRGFWEPYLL
ncbi:MAG: hypothetical protein HY318_11735 [Armatimonadetes bacterium]|nr:hypothetical protein [Armatimonadota bacterium]